MLAVICFPLKSAPGLFWMDSECQKARSLENTLIVQCQRLDGDGGELVRRGTVSQRARPVPVRAPGLRRQNVVGLPL